MQMTEDMLLKTCYREHGGGLRLWNQTSRHICLFFTLFFNDQRRCLLQVIRNTHLATL